MKHLLIILISILLSSFLVSCEEKIGKGRFTTPDGSKYVGEFKDGERNGQGTGILPDGTKFVGEHKDDRPWNGTIYDKNGNIDVKYVNGK